MVVLAPAAAPVQAQGAEQPLLTLLGGAPPVQAPDAAPAPTPAPTPSVACSDSGTDNREVLATCSIECPVEYVRINVLMGVRVVPLGNQPVIFDGQNLFSQT